MTEFNMGWLYDQGMESAKRIILIPDALLSPAGRDIKAIAIALLERDWLT